MTETIAGIEYQKPTVVLLQETGIGTSEYAARTCYDSFEASENTEVRLLNKLVHKGSKNLDEAKLFIATKDATNLIEHSDLLDDLAWTYFHHSILEHANLTYLIKDTSRGVLQEHARHRIQGISVRSTRYTMNSIINAFVASTHKVSTAFNSAEWFITKMLETNLLVTTDEEYNRIEYRTIFSKLLHQMNTIGRDKFIKSAVAKSALP